MPDSSNLLDVNDVIASAFKRIQLISDNLSFHQCQSQLSELNAHPQQWCPMGKDGMRVLKLAKALGKYSHDRFNCTVGGELVQQGALPRLVKHAFLTQGNWQDIELDTNQAKLRRPVLITLDGIAKGFAVDMAISVLKRHGITGGWVNAGGDLRVFGTASIVIQQRASTGLSNAIRLSQTALASSKISTNFNSDYPALIVGHRHLPIQDSMISISAKSAWRADALTKIAATDPFEAGRHLIEQLGGTIVTFEQDKQ